MRLRTQVILLFVVVTLSVGMGSSLLASRMMHDALESELRDQAVVAARILADHIAHNAIDGEVIEAQEAIRTVVEHSRSIQYAYIIDFDGRVFTHSFEGGFPKALAAEAHQHYPIPVQAPEMAYLKTNTGSVLEIVYPLVEGMKAHVHIGMDEEGMHTRIAALRSGIIGLTLLLVVVGIAVAALVSRRITRPLSDLADAMGDFGKTKEGGELMPSGGGREIVHLTRIFNRMIYDRKRAEEDVKCASVFMQTVVDGFPDALLVINRDYTIALANRTIQQFAGGQDPVAAYTKCHQLSHGREMPCDTDEHLCPMKEVIGSKAPVSVEHIHYDAHGHKVPFEIIAAPIFDEKGEVVQIIESSRDITMRKQAENDLLSEKQLSEEYINSLPGLFYVFNEQQFVRWNKEWNRITGYSDEELGSRYGTDFFEGEDRLRMEERMQKVFREGAAEAEAELVTKDGRQIPYYFTGLRKQINGRNHLIGLGIDITERKHMEDELEHLATHDPLTGLYNRNVLEQRLNAEIHRATRYSHTLSVFMVDIDHFKPINDTHGHRAGDTVLRGIAKVLESSIRKTDYAARYGGEEFIVILPETSLLKAEELAERLRSQVTEHPFRIEDDKELNLTASIGIATFPDHAQSWQDLLEVADSAMYAAKEAGRNQVKTP